MNARHFQNFIIVTTKLKVNIKQTQLYFSIAHTKVEFVQNVSTDFFLICQIV